MAASIPIAFAAQSNYYIRVFRVRTVIFALLFFGLLSGAEAKKHHHGSTGHHGHHHRRIRHATYRVTEGTSYREQSRAVARPFSTVVIDAGHGGEDPGGIPSNIIPEKGVALDVALRLQARLRKAGIRTVMTRTDDTFIPLPTRVAIANAQGAAIFVSIHFNAGVRREAHGFETYFSSPDAIPLARRIQSHLLNTTPTMDRGVKQAGFYVLRKTDIVSVLAECGFLTNPQEANLARDPAFRQRLADEIGAAIIEYKRGMD